MIYFPPYKKVNAFVHKMRLFCLPSRSLAWTVSILFSKIIFGNIAVSTFFTIIILAAVDHDQEHHSAWTLLWVGFLGVMSALLTMIQYLPQIIETYLRKSVGALSIPMLLMQTPGSILLTVSLALSPGANWSTWLPYAIASFFQSMLLVLCLVFFIRAKKRGVSSFHSPETAPLLVTRGATQMYGGDSSEEHGLAGTKKPSLIAQDQNQS
ncbi:hypothetical protein BX616_010099 [Lobosporangium transversale]|nr:hypothetical protein BX616_010099 [Lobosporangium transversale]